MSTTVEVPESQRLIAVSLGKIAASRGQKGGINLHKNLLVATVLHKARTAYMIQQFAKQRAAQPPPPTATSPPPPSNVEMREQPSEVSEPSSTTTTSSSSPSSTAAPTFPTAAPSTPAAPPTAGVAPAAGSGSVPDGAAVSSVQVAECEDKENTPPPSSPAPQGDAAPCEKRLQGENVNAIKDSANEKNDKARPHGSLTQTQKSTRDYVSKGCSSCLLKRRRAMASDHENVSAPKVRIVDTRLSQQQQQQDSNPEPMQCDSPQISNLVNIFSSSFAGLSGAGGDASVRSVVVSVSSHKLSDSSNMATCAKELKAGLDSVRQPLVLSV